MKETRYIYIFLLAKGFALRLHSRSLYLFRFRDRHHYFVISEEFPGFGKPKLFYQAFDGEKQQLLAPSWRLGKCSQFSSSSRESGREPRSGVELSLLCPSGGTEYSTLPLCYRSY